MSSYFGDNTLGPDHADLHAVGKIGYIEFYYRCISDLLVKKLDYQVDLC